MLPFLGGDAVLLQGEPMGDSTFGIGAALSAALCWAIATRLFSGLVKVLNPATLNSAKGAIAITLLLLTLGGRSLLMHQPWLGLTPSEMGVLALSGVLGIGVGDTAYFGAVNQLGPRQALLLEAGAPIVTASLAWIFLKEELTGWAVVGMAIAISGIVWTLAEQTPAPARPLNPQSKLRGIGWGIVAALAQAGGSVIARGTLVAGDVDPLDSALVRLVAGSAIALAIATFTHRLQQNPQPLSLLPPNIKELSWAFFGRLLLATTLGTYLGIWLQQTALKYALAGIAQTCLATSPLFILPILWITGERFSRRAIAGALVTVLGIIVLAQS